jgi:thiol:disulfide interchange protein DsbC
MIFERSPLNKRDFFPMRATLVALSFISLSAFAGDTPAKDPATIDEGVTATIHENLVKLGLKTTGIQRSPVDGLFQVITERGLFYFSENGQFLVHGKVYDLTNEIENITEKALSQVRIDGMKEFEDSMIVFPAKDEKYKVTVFTDTNCGYCRKLHAQMSEYNDLGITVRYMAFPRSGPQGPTFDQMTAIWCADDKQEALTIAKNGDKLDISKNKMCKVPIVGQYSLGMKVGVSGTPAIMFDDGTMIPGYQDPGQLVQVLASKPKMLAAAK